MRAIDDSPAASSAAPAWRDRDLRLLSDADLLSVPGIGAVTLRRLRDAFGTLGTVRRRARRPVLVFDIETRPAELWNDPAFVDEVRAEIEPPSNYKDPLKIASYVDAELGKRRARAALSPAFGKVAVIGYAWFGDAHEPEAIAGDDEARVLRDFAALLAERGPSILAGYNVREFDVPFVTMRAAAQAVELPSWWPNRRDWSAIVDPMDLVREGRLDDYLRAFGLPRKTCSTVDSLELPLPELVTYCRNDVHVERLLLERLRDRFDALRAREDLEP